MNSHFRMAADNPTGDEDWVTRRWVCHPAKQLTVIDATLAPSQAHSFHRSVSLLSRRARIGNGKFEYGTALPAMALFLAILGLPATAIGQSITNFTQQVVRLNPKRDPGNPAYTIADCVVSEHCLWWLTQTLVQAGGNPGLLAGTTQEPQPDVSGDQSIYRFEAPAGESFCKAVLLRVSVAPNFGAFAPELKFSASKKAIHATVRLPAGDGAPTWAWYDGILILLSVKDVAFAESSCSLKEVAQEVACKGKCEKTIKF